MKATIEIDTVENGFVVRQHVVPGGVPITHVFETPESLGNWVDKWGSDALHPPQKNLPPGPIPGAAPGSGMIY